MIEIKVFWNIYRSARLSSEKCLESLAEYLTKMGLTVGETTVRDEEILRITTWVSYRTGCGYYIPDDFLLAPNVFARRDFNGGHTAEV